MRSSVMLCILHSLFTDLAISQKADEPIAFKYKGMIWDVSNFVYEHTYDSKYDMQLIF